MCLLAAAFPHLYLNTSSIAYLQPPQRLEFDMRGRIRTGKDMNFVTIEVVEVKSRMEYADAVEQLGLRLGGLKWFVSACMPSSGAVFNLEGHLTVPTIVAGSEWEVADDQRAMAEQKWGFSLYVHFV